jgi:hypothetical protein
MHFEYSTGPREDLTAEALTPAAFTSHARAGFLVADAGRTYSRTLAVLVRMRGSVDPI